jgi:carboxypeptidase PM20D1
MMLGGSDTHHYAGVAANRYGFLPLSLNEADLERLHGPNERIGIEAFTRMIGFYMTFIENIAGK